MLRCFLARRTLILSTIISQAARRAALLRPRGVAGPPRPRRLLRDWSMPNKMLIDATHPEETRVVVLRGNRVEEFDFESANRKQLRGNIYLAKVTRVEPSLQAAFVDYGGNRHGFLAFSEIHPDYYQIPIADRQALIAEDERAQRAAEAEAERRASSRQRATHRNRDEIKSEAADSENGSETPNDEHITAGPEDAGERTQEGVPAEGASAEASAEP